MTEIVLPHEMASAISVACARIAKTVGRDLTDAETAEVVSAVSAHFASREIVHIDVDLAEDHKTVLFTGHTRNRDRTFVASVVLPTPIDPNAFVPNEWRECAGLRWRHVQ